MGPHRGHPRRLPQRLQGCGPALMWGLLLMQGCATPGRPVEQQLRVETPGCAEARCELRNDRGTWHVARTPGTVTLWTSTEPLRVSCRGGDGTLYDARSPSAKQPLTGAGAVTGGVAGGAAVGVAVGGPVLGFIPALGFIIVAAGVAVGALAGQGAESSHSALQYPAVISVPMSCPAAAAPMAATTSAPMTIPVTAPTDAAVAAAPVPPLGLTARGWPATRVREAGAGEGGAVKVTGVTAGGAAADAGLREGDLILAADGQPTPDATALQERLAAWPPGAALSLSVWREGRLMVLWLRRRGASP